jgi:hypothetical protein
MDRTLTVKMVSPDDDEGRLSKIVITSRVGERERTESFTSSKALAELLVVVDLLMSAVERAEVGGNVRVSPKKPVR